MVVLTPKYGFQMSWYGNNGKRSGRQAAFACGEVLERVAPGWPLLLGRRAAGQNRSNISLNDDDVADRLPMVVGEGGFLSVCVDGCLMQCLLGMVGVIYDESMFVLLNIQR